MCSSDEWWHVVYEKWCTESTILGFILFLIKYHTFKFFSLFNTFLKTIKIQKVRKIITGIILLEYINTKFFFADADRYVGSNQIETSANWISAGVYDIILISLSFILLSSLSSMKSSVFMISKTNIQPDTLSLNQ